MPTIRSRDTVGANGVVNPLVGSQYEYLPFNAQVEIALLANPGDVFEASVFSGSDVLMQNDQIDEKPATEPVQYPWDFTIEDVALQGERLGITLRETAGAAGSIVRTVVRITPL